MSLCEQVLGPVSAALRLLPLLAGQHGDEHSLAAAVGQRVGLLLVPSDAQAFALAAGTQMFLPPLWLQADVGCSSGVTHDQPFQLRCFVLLLFRHLSLWAVVEDLPQQGPGLSPYPGRSRAPLASLEVSFSVSADAAWCVAGRSTTVWLCTPPGPPSPRSSISPWSCTCGGWSAAQRPRRPCASSLERWPFGEMARISAVLAVSAVC